jgi:nucleotide-binding universal stress UspA family protein
VPCGFSEAESVGVPMTFRRPAFTIGTKRDEEAEMMRTIVVGYDGSEAAKRALERAAELVEGGRLTVVAGVPLTPHSGRGPGPTVDPAEKSERERDLDEAAAFAAEKGVEARTVFGHGDPAEAIVAEARDLGADLVVVGTRGRNVVSRAILGSVSTRVVHDAPCDVLVVR